MYCALNQLIRTRKFHFSDIYLTFDILFIRFITYATGIVMLVRFDLLRGDYIMTVGCETRYLFYIENIFLKKILLFPIF